MGSITYLERKSIEKKEVMEMAKKEFVSYVKHDDNTVSVFNAERVKEGNTVTYSFRFNKELSVSEVDQSIIDECEAEGYASR